MADADVHALLAALRQTSARLADTADPAERTRNAAWLAQTVSSWFGGMGSPSDLVLTDPADPTRMDAAANVALGACLGRLRAAARQVELANRAARHGQPADGQPRPTPRPP